MFINTLFSDPILFFRVVIILIISITLHELAHGFAAISQGDNTPRQTGHITLNPVIHMGVPSLVFLCIAGISWGQMPVNPSEFKFPQISNIFVSAAGPLSNLGLALIAILIIKVAQSIQFISSDFLILFAHINLVLCLFNLIPIPPLDGFHVVSEIWIDLKKLTNSNLSYFALTILFVFPVIGKGLSTVADLIIESLL
jgi:Zn-dependent protease